MFPVDASFFPPSSPLLSLSSPSSFLSSSSSYFPVSPMCCSTEWPLMRSLNSWKPPLSPTALAILSSPLKRWWWWCFPFLSFPNILSPSLPVPSMYSTSLCCPLACLEERQKHQIIHSSCVVHSYDKEEEICTYCDSPYQRYALLCIIYHHYLSWSLILWYSKQTALQSRSTGTIYNEMI